MPTRNIRRQATVQGPVTPNVAPIYVDSDDNILKMIPAGSGTTEVQIVDVSSAQTLTNKTITGSLAASSIETVTATNVIAASESGTTFFLNSTTEFVSTLPAPAAGLKFKFVVVGAPSGASYTIVAASGTPIHGVGVSSADAGGSASGTNGTGVLTITLVDGQAKKGDTVILESDGTDWYALAFMFDEDAITFS